MRAESQSSPAPVTAAGVSIARRLDFHGPQPSYFGVPRASAEAMSTGDFIGDTREGGGCNAEVLTLNPHCHGTHTECVGHITDARLHAIDVVPQHPLRALLVSLSPEPAHRVDEHKPGATEAHDLLLTAASLRPSLSTTRIAPQALIIRTLPNPPDKRYRQYLDSGDYPYLTLSAVQDIVAAGIRHLLIDTPSLDRLDDDGELAVHRAFWNLPPRARTLNASSRDSHTVTEMIYVDDAIVDGAYRLSLQAAPFTGDATPSNPILFPWTDTE